MLQVTDKLYHTMLYQVTDKLYHTMLYQVTDKLYHTMLYQKEQLYFLFFLNFLFLSIIVLFFLLLFIRPLANICYREDVFLALGREVNLD
jgi:hypothetical protein